MFKVCKSCNESKPLIDFSKDLSRKDGLCYRCRKCVKNKVPVIKSPVIETDCKICSSCKRNLNKCEYNKNKKSKDGLGSKCKDCVKIYNQNIKNKEKFPITVNTKLCPKCKEEKTIDCFGKSYNYADGLQKSCKTCLNKKAIENKKKRDKHPRPEDGFVICKKCNLSKHTSEFYSDCTKLSGLQSNCIDCVKEKVNFWVENNRDRVNENNKKYQNLNKEKVKEQRKISNEKRKDKRKAYYKLYLKNNKEKINLNLKIRRDNDLLFKLRCNIRCSIKDSFNRFIKKGFLKSKKSGEILGCTIEEFKKHIESQFLNWMNFDNHGYCENLEYNCSWNIDHIIPISYTKTEEDLYLLNHWSNFQPMCARINIVDKSANIYPCTNLELGITFWEDKYEYINKHE